MGLSFEEAYQILELPRGSSQDEIRSSYKRLALKWHPDKHGNSSEATKKFQEVSSAYKRLTSDDDDDDIVMTPDAMFELFAHIFFANGMFGCMHHHDSDYDDELTDDDSMEDEFLGGIASRLRRKYERYEKATEKKTSAHNLSEAEALRNAEELIQEEEKERKKAEKRRAKKKRNKERKKQKDKEKEKEKDSQLKKDGKENRQNSGTGQESRNNSNIKNTTVTDKKNNNLSNNSNNSKKNSSNINSGLREKKNNEQNPQASKKVSGKNKMRHEEDSDSHAEEPAWDTSSAFFAHAAGQPTPGQAVSKSAPSSNTNDTTSPPTEKQSDCVDSKNGSVPTQGKGEQMDPTVLKSRQIAVRGNEMANAGNYQVAVQLFTEAIDLDSRDFRFFGNRSYCFDRMGQFEKALQDANLAITLAPDWPKGYFRRGRALAGLKLFSDAESSFSQVLKLDKYCEDAMFELARVRVQQLEEMGFPYVESEAAIQAYGTVQAALEALLAGKVKINVAEEIYMSDGEGDSTAVRNRISENGVQCQALWVGNVDPEHVSERDLIQLFSRCAKVYNVRLLPKRFCAFVNFSTPEGASIALETLQGCEIGGQKLLLRYPNNTGAPGTENAPLRKPVAPTSVAAPESISQARLFINQPSKVTGPVNGDECYFWRTSGCAFGDKCKYAHVPAHKSIDLRKVEAKYGGRLRHQVPNGKS